MKLHFSDCVLKNWVFLKLLIFNFFSNNVFYFCNFFIVAILDVTIEKKWEESYKSVLFSRFSASSYNDLSIAHVSLGVS